MSKKLKAAVAGLAFVAGCEVGIALQLVKMIRDYTIKEKALDEALETSEEDAAEIPADMAPEASENTTEAGKETADVPEPSKGPAFEAV